MQPLLLRDGRDKYTIWAHHTKTNHLLVIDGGWMLATDGGWMVAIYSDWMVLISIWWIRLVAYPPDHIVHRLYKIPAHNYLPSYMKLALLVYTYTALSNHSSIVISLAPHKNKTAINSFSIQTNPTSNDPTSIYTSNALIIQYCQLHLKLLCPAIS